MKFKYILFYLSVILIIALTIIGMIILKNNVNFKPRKVEIPTNIKINEATKINLNFEWVYDNSLSHDNIIIPYINIKDNKIKELNNNFKIDDKVISSDYLYTFNGDLLSIIYTKNYENKVEYETYNINMGNTSILNSLETLEYLDINISKIKNICLSSIEMELKLQKYDDLKYEEYYNKTKDEFINMFYNGDLKLYIGNEKDVSIIVKIYGDHNYYKIVNIIDK